MFKKLLRGSIFICLMIILSISLSGCSIGEIVSGFKNTFGSVLKGVGNVVSAVADVARNVIDTVKPVVSTVANTVEKITGKPNSIEEKVNGFLDNVSGVISKVDNVAQEVKKTGEEWKNENKGNSEQAEPDSPQEVIDESNDDDNESEEGSSNGTEVISDPTKDEDEENANSGDNISIKLTIVNSTSETLTIGREADEKDVVLIVYGAAYDENNYVGYIRLAGKFDGKHTIPAGGSVSGTCKIIGGDPRFNGYPFAQKDQLLGNWKANCGIYKPDGSSYACNELSGTLVSGKSYTITYCGGPDNAN